MTMKITNEKIKKLDDFYREIETLKIELDNEYVGAREGAENKKQSLVRKTKDGEKEVEISEDRLWYELRNLGWQSQAGETMKKTYPKVFELYEKHSKAVSDMEDFCLKELNINPTKITLLDIIRIVEGVINGKNEKD